MSATATDVRRFIQQIVGDMRNLPIIGEVVSVNGEECSVKLSSGLEVKGVRLKATITEGKQKVLLTPLVGSDVVVMSSTGDLNNLFVVSINEVEKLEILNNDVTIVIDDKVTVDVAGVNLASTLNDLCDTLASFQVYTGVGPSGTALPPTQQKIIKLKKDFETIFK